MHLLDLKVSIAWLFLSFIILPLVGFVFRSAQLKKRKKQIKELEEQMVNSHFEILALQAQLAIPKENPVRALAIDESCQYAEGASKGKLKVSAM